MIIYPIWYIVIELCLYLYHGFDRNSFMTAFIQSGIPTTVANKMIERIKSFMPKWEVLIDESFLPDKMKADYHLLLSKRIEML